MSINLGLLKKVGNQKFWTRKGLRYGCTLLLRVYLESAFKSWKQKYKGIGVPFLPVLLANDLVLIAGDKNDLGYVYRYILGSLRRSVSLAEVPNKERTKIRRYFRFSFMSLSRKWKIKHKGMGVPFFPLLFATDQLLMIAGDKDDSSYLLRKVIHQLLWSRNKKVVYYTIVEASDEYQVAKNNLDMISNRTEEKR